MGMDPFTLIDKYYAKGSPLYDILVTHSRRVAEKAQEIANSHPELEADENFLYEAAMLHDIGILPTHPTYSVSVLVLTFATELSAANY